MCDPVFEGLSFQQLDCDEVQTFGFSNLIYRTDVWMIERRSGFRLKLETVQRLSVASDKLGEKLESEEPPQIDILGLIHHSHAAAPEYPKNAVMRDNRSFRQRPG